MPEAIERFIQIFLHTFVQNGDFLYETLHQFKQMGNRFSRSYFRSFYSIGNNCDVGFGSLSRICLKKAKSQ